jgi:hypothetical protein
MPVRTWSAPELLAECSLGGVFPSSDDNARDDGAIVRPDLRAGRFDLDVALQFCSIDRH